MMKRVLGISLIETILVIIIVGLIVGSGAFMVQKGIEASIIQNTSSLVQGEAMAALGRMTRDIQMLRSENDILTMTATTFSFIDTDGATITYTLSGSNLTLDGQVLAGNVSALTFTYLDEDGLVTAVSTDVKYITIDLTFTKDSYSFSIQTTVFPREV